MRILRVCVMGMIFNLILLANTLNVNAEGLKVNSGEYETIKISDYNFTEQEILHLKQISVAEAGNQGIGGQAYIMQVVINRLNNPDFPDTIDEVLNQPNQFSDYSKYEPNENSEKALELLEILHNPGALWFETIETKNSWASKHKHILFTCNAHRFYG